MVQGREFTAAEEATVGGTTPVIVDITLAERLFANENPVGQLLQYGADSGTADSRPMGMCHAIRLRGHQPLNRESAHRSSSPSCLDLQNGDASRRKAGRPHPGVLRDRLRERPAERDHPFVESQ
jgi:hypothetical protein